jgi:hypothetical protein
MLRLEKEVMLDVKCLFTFSIQLLLETFLCNKYLVSYMCGVCRNRCRFSRKLPVIVVQL